MLDFNKLKGLNKSKVFFRFKKIDRDYLITNDIANYSFLTKEEFLGFITNKLSKKESKYKELLKKGFIKSGKDYELNMKKKYIKKNQFLAYGPSLHIIVITLRCNHKCKYCHAAAASISAKKYDMDKQTAKGIVDTIFFTSNPNITIEFQGGEPLANWDIIKYITEYAEIKAQHLNKNLKFALVTNLTLMDNDKLDYIIKHNISISTSLDGNEEVHNYNRTFRRGNSFSDVSYWIKKINKKYKKEGLNLKVGALLTVTRKTLNKWQEVIDTYIELGLDSIFIRSLNPYGFANKDIVELGYSNQEFIEFYKKSMNYIIKLNKKGIVFKEILSSIFLGKILTENDPNYLDERSPCGACIGQVAYNYDGKIYSCDEGRMLARMGDDNFLMTSLKDNGEQTYKEMINSDTTKIMVQASTLDGLPGYNDSVYKPYIGVCPIYSYKTNNNIIPNYSKDNKRYLDYKILDYLFKNLRIEGNKEIFSNWLGIEKNTTTSQCG